MAAVLDAEVLDDGVAVSLARAIAAANRQARERGIDASESLITITQVGSEQSKGWRINYGPKAYINRRGGDLIVEVDAADATIRNVVRGQ